MARLPRLIPRSYHKYRFRKFSGSRKVKSGFCPIYQGKIGENNVIANGSLQIGLGYDSDKHKWTSQALFGKGSQIETLPDSYKVQTLRVLLKVMQGLEGGLIGFRMR